MKAIKTGLKGKVFHMSYHQVHVEVLGQEADNNVCEFSQENC